MEKAIIVNKVTDILASILEEKRISQDEFSLDESLYEEGIGLDSLDAATLSVMLEHAFDADPYSDGRFPQTVGDIVHYYVDQEET